MAHHRSGGAHRHPARPVPKLIPRWEDTFNVLIVVLLCWAAVLATIMAWFAVQHEIIL